MLSSLGLDTKDSSRSTRNGPSKYFEVPRGFSVHVFKTPTVTTSTHPYNASGKFDVAHRRPSGVVWSKPAEYPPHPTDPERKLSLTTAPARRVVQPSVYEPSFETKGVKMGHNYGIYPSSTDDTYIYERSVSPTSDLFRPSSPSSSSSESDILSESAVSASVEISSTRASSSTETLETTALSVRGNVLNTVSPAPSAHFRSTPSSGPPRAITDGILSIPPGLPPPSNLKRAGGAPTFALPLQFTSVETVSDSDSDTVIDDPVMDMLQPRRTSDPGAGARDERRDVKPARSLPIPPTTRRNSDAASAASSARAFPTARPTDHPAPMSAAPPRNGEGKAYTAPPSSRINGGDGPAIPVPSAAPFSAPVMEGSNLAVSTRRCVRWSEDLICPSPILRSERRKGWFNRRGDQLWTNDGRYKSPEVGQEFPSDLADYPEFNDGWMNEEGVRIDMEHRLIPKPPLRSALKRPKNAQANQ